MNHFKTGEGDHGSWGRPQQVDGTTTIETRDAILLENLLDAVDDTRILSLGVVALFLKS